MSESLLGGACGGARCGVRRNPPPVRTSGHRRQGTSYAQGASPPAAVSGSTFSPSEWRVMQRRSSPPLASAAPPLLPPPATSLKRRRSPELLSSCARYFCPGHSASECRHLVSCRRCGGTGHVAASCSLPASSSEPLAPRRRRPRSHRQSLPPQAYPSQSHPSPTPSLPNSIPVKPPVSSSVPAPAPPPRFSSSIPVTKEILKAKEDLRTLAVISVFAGNACLESLAHEIPAVLGVPPDQRVSSFMDHNLTLSRPSAQAIKSAEKLGRIHLHGQFGPFTVTIAPWSPEIGSIGPAVGVTRWVSIYNLPLHCWS